MPGILHQLKTTLGMAHTGGSQLLALVEFFQRIAAGRVQQTVEHIFVTDFDIEQRFGHQLRDGPQHFAPDHRRG